MHISAPNTVHIQIVNPIIRFRGALCKIGRLCLLKSVSFSSIYYLFTILISRNDDF